MKRQLFKTVCLFKQHVASQITAHVKVLSSSLAIQAHSSFLHQFIAC